MRRPEIRRWAAAATTHKATVPFCRVPVLALVLVSSIGAAAPLDGQSREHGPVILELPASTSAMAMGGAFQLTGGRSDAIFSNPALLADASGFGLDGQTFDSKSNYLALSAVTEWWEGNVGVGLQTLSYSTDGTSGGDVASGETDLLIGGALGSTEFVATIGYAQEVAGLEWGIAAKTVEHRLGGTKDVALAADLGVSVEVGDIRVGLTAQNLGSDLQVGGASMDLAQRVTLGASGQGWQAGPFDLGASAALSREADGTVIPALGGEIAWWPIRGRTFTGWIGVRRVEDGPADEVTFGAAFHGDAFGVEYAYQGFDSLGGAHRLGISWRWSARAPSAPPRSGLRSNPH
jgi:hypothetical protein